MMSQKNQNQKSHLDNALWNYWKFYRIGYRHGMDETQSFDPPKDNIYLKTAYTNGFDDAIDDRDLVAA